MIRINFLSSERKGKEQKGRENEKKSFNFSARNKAQKCKEGGWWYLKSGILKLNKV